MLILTRRSKEAIRINDNISITVLGIKGNQVRLGIDAPRDVTVHREEIYQRILDEQQEGTIEAKPEVVEDREDSDTSGAGLNSVSSTIALTV